MFPSAYQRFQTHTHINAYQYMSTHVNAGTTECPIKNFPLLLTQESKVGNFFGTLCIRNTMKDIDEGDDLK